MLALTESSQAQRFGVGGRNWGVGVGQPYYGGGYGWGNYGYGSNYGYGYGSPYYSGRYWGSPYYGTSYANQSYYYPSYSTQYYSTPSYYTTGDNSYYASQPAFSGGSQSFYSGQDEDRDSNPNAIHVRLMVPPDARVWFEDQATQQSGMDRLFVSPPMQPGKDYVYHIKAQWMENGQQVNRSKDVTVHAATG